MNFRAFNDYEILELIKQGSEEALELMVEKYRFLIAKKIASHHLQDEFDDCFQESVILLYKSVMRFEDRFNKTFTKYFEHNLENLMITLLRKRIRYRKFLSDKAQFLIREDERGADAYNDTKREVAKMLTRLSPLERRVFAERFEKQATIRETALRLGIAEKQVHNAVDRIRKKLNREILP
jgi:RNA polymerase sporulation-specific sigma factor